jgi:hypothetical protein
VTTTATKPTAPVKMRETAYGVLVHQVVQDQDHPANNGPVVAYAFHDLAIARWVVRLTGTQDLWSYRDRQAALVKLAEMTGAVIP